MESKLVRVRRTTELDSDIEQLKVSWRTSNVSEIIRRAARLAAQVNRADVDDVYVVVKGQRHRLPPA